MLLTCASVKAWDDLPLEMKRKYIEFWMDNNPLSHGVRDRLDPDHKTVASMARTVFSNVPEPPIKVVILSAAFDQLSCNTCILPY